MRLLASRSGRFGLAGVMLLAALFAGMGPAATAADSRDEIEQKRAANQAELQQLQAELEGTSAELTQAYLDLQAATKEVPLAQATMEAAQQDYATAQQEYAEVSDKLAAAELSRDRVAQELADNQNAVANARRALGQMARAVMASDQATTNDLLLLLGASDIKDAAQAQMTAQAFSATREAALTKAQQSAGENTNHQARLEAVTDEITDLKAQAEAAMQKAEAAKVEAEEAKAQLDALVASLETLTTDLEARQAEETERQAELVAQQKVYDDELARIVAAEMANAADQGGPGPPPGSGFFGWPTSTTGVSSYFGVRTHPISGDQRHHAGVDFALGCGSSIYASADGTVVQAGWAGGYGYRTVVSHGSVMGANMMSTYNHQPDTRVSVGQAVSKGSVIGVVGTTGASTGCHLHFEILKNGQPVDPLPYLR